MGDLPVATLRPNGSSISMYYVHTDHLGSARKVTRPSDNGLMWRWDPDTFGSVAPNQNPSGLGSFVYNLRFPGQYSLNESGLYYNYFRDYDPQMGRYIESDRMGLAGGINTYAYAGGNPLSAIDPMGLFGICRRGSSYYDCGAEPPATSASCQQAIMSGPYIVGWTSCRGPQSPSNGCNADVSAANGEYDLFAPLTPHIPADPHLQAAGW